MGNMLFWLKKTAASISAKDGIALFSKMSRINWLAELFLESGLVTT
jgi:hypothetical protein